MEQPNNTHNTPVASDNALLKSKRQQSFSEYATAYINKIRSGDLGILPIIIGMIVIGILFQALNQNFLSAKNLVNLSVQMSAITTLGFGVVFVLLLGEIDLSIGYVSAVVAVTMVMLLKGPIPEPTIALAICVFFGIGIGVILEIILTRFISNTMMTNAVCAFVALIAAILMTSVVTRMGMPWYLAIPFALITASGIGWTHGNIITYFKLPAFIVTVAGLLAWNGVVLIIIGGAGTVILQDQIALGIANTYISRELGWIIAIVGVALFLLNEMAQVRTRQRIGLNAKPAFAIALQTALLALVVGIAVWVANNDRGVPLIAIGLIIMMFGLSYLSTRTTFGRYVMAVGGNAEAARRAGVDVSKIRVRVFMISSVMAGIGGMILASRLRSVDTNAGGGQVMLNSIAAAVIGGTSLFGGSGKISSALLGAVIIAGVENGMGLLGLPAGVKFIVTALVLLLAVVVDAIGRRNQQQAGKR